uniref:Uncharacterized protein n=1 Tax=Oryza sativa subsp. japonica TaxID=39947 RepID=Q6H803_ORYSJ|nr:hypothetical protein [Oryza sativa Japonica Group]
MDMSNRANRTTLHLFFRQSNRSAFLSSRGPHRPQPPPTLQPPAAAPEKAKRSPRRRVGESGGGKIFIYGDKLA